MLNCWYHHILLSFVSKIPDLCLFHNRFGEDCCCSEIYFKLTWTLRQIAFELLHFLQLCATAIPLLKSRFIMELSAPARSISSLCIGMNHRNVNLDSEFTLHFWKENSVTKLVSRISPGTRARYACLLSFDAKNYEAKQFLVQKFAAGQSVMMTGGQPGQNAPLGPSSTFSCRPKFQRQRYEEEKHYGLRSGNILIISYFWPLILENDNLSGSWKENTFLFPWERLPTTRLPRWKAQSCHWFFPTKHENENVHMMNIYPKTSHRPLLIARTWAGKGLRALF